MKNINLIKKLNFLPKENSTGIYTKTYSNCGNYIIEVDFENENFNYGNLISSESKTTQNFSQAENWVVFECVDRLLEKGYKPNDITLEKTFPSGHGHSGRLDILVEKEGKAFLMIECKTYGKEFDKGLKNIHKNGGQLFTYFQQDTNTDILMLYTSELQDGKLEFKNEIIKVEEHYKKATNVEDFHDRWNKISNQTGIFDEWVSAYQFKNQLLRKKDLTPISEKDSGFIFHQFAAILRKHSVSDKPNAFNKIFNLFLAKIFDEKKKDNDVLEFQWKENEDDDVDFQVRLINLHKKGMQAFLQKEVEGIDDEDFNYKTVEKLKALRKKILKFNNVFAIKEVIDDESFEDNAKVLKEVVELLKKYQIRYPRRQQHLSNFFERLLTTGLKQESGQFFTPIPIAKFIIKSLPIKNTIEKILSENEIPELPTFIDYAAGSGHFLTETMEEIQNIIDNTNTADFYPDVQQQVEIWKIQKYNWAAKYIYGIEKDYRLVKVAKVGCYFYGDGLAQVIHGDGLDSFYNSNSYRGLLKQQKQNNELKKFDFIISNPPYSVQNFKGDIKNNNVKDEFKIYKYLTDKSKEIESLFIERTTQLLKIGGIAGIVLPSSILSNGGIYQKARELILIDFEIIAITKLGSSTFMATGTNTVVLFLKKRKPQISVDTKESVDIIFDTLKNNTVNGIETPVSKYLTHVWESISFDDYKTLIQKNANDSITQHEIYQDYIKKIKAKNTKEKLQKIIDLEKEKLFYFILAYPQKVVLINTGDKKAEKQFLGYEFSNRRGSEGIHPIQRGKLIEECTQLFDANKFENPEKASTYIYQAFNGKLDSEIPENLQKNISRIDLVDMLTFDRVDFDKDISLSAKKKIKIESKWELVRLGEFIFEQAKSKIKVGTAKDSINGNYLFFTSGENILKYTDYLVDKENIYLSTGGNAIVKYYNGKASYSTDTFAIKSNNELKLKTKFLYYFIENIIHLVNEFYFKGVGLKHLQKTDLRNIKIPLPPKKIQEKIVSEIEVLEIEEGKARTKAEKLKSEISEIVATVSENDKIKKLREVCEMRAGKFVSASNIIDKNNNELYPCYGGNGLRGYTETYTHEGNFSLIGRQGALSGNIHLVSGKFHATEHAVVVTTVDEVNVNWLNYQLIKMNLNQYAKGTAQPGLTVSHLKTLSISVPPLPEQQKIVSKIETIEAKIEKLENETAQIPKEKEAILKKYL